MAKAKVSQSAVPKKQDQPSIKLSEQIPEEYYLTSEQMDSMRHLVLAAQGIYHHFKEQEEPMAWPEFILGFSGGFSSIMEEIQEQRISDIETEKAGGAR